LDLKKVIQKLTINYTNSLTEIVKSGATFCEFCVNNARERERRKGGNKTGAGLSQTCPWVMVNG
jgi:hypothetical protein